MMDGSQFPKSRIERAILLVSFPIRIINAPIAALQCRMVMVVPETVKFLDRHSERLRGIPYPSPAQVWLRSGMIWLLEEPESALEAKDEPHDRCQASQDGALEQSDLRLIIRMPPSVDRPSVGGNSPKSAPKAPASQAASLRQKDQGVH